MASQEHQEEDDVFRQISSALESWLDNLSVLEERQQIVSSLQERINRTLLQIQHDGLVSVYDFEGLRYIGRIWSDLINLFSSTTSTRNKRLIINNLLRLYESGQISMNLFIEVVMTI